MDISVIIPTRNRAALLEKCLERLCAQTLDPARYEICVIDNGSTDNTKEIIAAVAARHKDRKIIMVEESAPSVAVARNRGVAATRAPLIALADDDTMPPPDWLTRYIDGMERLGPEVAKIAGTYTPVWGAVRPAWLTDGMLPLLSAAAGPELKPGFTDFPLLEGNSCYRREALERFGGFPRQLGRSGNSLISGELMIDLVIRMNGWKLYYDPAIVIDHHIHANRLTPLWMRQRYFWQGVSDYAARVYLKKMGISIDHAIKIELPLDVGDWAFINNASLPPTEQNLDRLRSLGLVLAKTGIIPVEA